MSEFAKHAPQDRPEKQPTEMSRDFQLTPERVEMVMSKVQDIDTPGTAYTFLRKSRKDIIEGEDQKRYKSTANLEALRSVLKNGLLGTDKEDRYRGVNTSIEDMSKDWSKRVRKEKVQVVHFNIVGRAHDNQGSSVDTQISKAFYLHDGQRWGDYLTSVPFSCAFIFDLESFKEVQTGIYHVSEGGPHVNKTYTPVIENYDDIQRSLSHPFKPREEFGFVLAHRVKPRGLRGLIIKERLPAGYSEPNREGVRHFKYKDEVDFQKYDERVAQIVDIMLSIYKDKEELLLPIYDVHGNLLWPKKLSYSEIRSGSYKTAK